ncbi:hypothetical protein C1H46_006957 [Malus baccata]|uniref:Uncharacterized protein n=1 Tax=Malus baccata TaxID=106549 RepID=A0A540N8R1_MALBA|nr:hypothetical protein C1H46_006957 [Malus baccata]
MTAFYAQSRSNQTWTSSPLGVLNPALLSKTCHWPLDQLHLQRSRRGTGGGATVHHLVHSPQHPPTTLSFMMLLCHPQHHCTPSCKSERRCKHQHRHRSPVSPSCC